jgi:DNA-binding response OmpR family regulator
LKTKVLLVDDDPSVRESLCRVLQSEDYDVVTAGNGQEALECFSAHHISLVLLDLNMPITDGWATLKQIRAIHPFLPIIITTARPNQRELAAEIAAVAIMEKPLVLPVLLKLMHQLMKEPAETRPHRMAEHKPVHLWEARDNHQN